MVEDLNPGGATGFVKGGCACGPIAASAPDVYFAGNDGVHGYQVWRSDGTILFSDDLAAVGHRYPGESDLQQAARGEVLSHVSDLADPENVTERPLGSKLFETYVPFLLACCIAFIVLPYPLFAIMLGGEHTASLGGFRGIKRVHPDAVILQVDAHLDMRPEYEGQAFTHATWLNHVADTHARPTSSLRTMSR